MNYNQTLEHMRVLRLHGLADALENLLETRKAASLSSEQLLALLLQNEHDERTGRKIDRLKKAAKFRYNATLNQFQPDPGRNLDATVLAQLTTCSWVTQNETILITGPAGVGKSNLASALGNQV